MHASMTEDFANATKGFNHPDMSQKWLDVAVGLVRKMIEDINPIKKKLMLDIFMERVLLLTCPFVTDLLVKRIQL